MSILFLLRLITIILLFAIHIESYACSDPGQPPIPGMNISAPRCVGRNINFQAAYVAFPPGVNDVTHYFDFGDGVFDTLLGGGLQFQTWHAYSDTGTYYVSLIKENPFGRDTTYDTIYMNGNPIVDFSVNLDSFCFGLTSQFTDLSTVGKGSTLSIWAWDFGDYYSNENLDSTQNPSHYFSETDSFMTTLKVTNTAGCSSDTSKLIIVSEDTMLAQFNYTANCPKCNDVIFNSIGTGTQIDWKFGDGDSAIGNNASHLFALPGAYDVHMSGINAAGCKFVNNTKIGVCVGNIPPSSKSNYNWFFHDTIGVSFLSGAPVEVFGSKLLDIGKEGAASISHPITGQLLFYSNGLTVWNRNHAVMGNGTGLAGGNSDNQSHVIVPFPGDTAKYYIFTRHESNNNFRYSVVDMTLNGGLGGVINKNTIYYTKTNYAGQGYAGVEKKVATCSTAAEYWVLTTIDTNEYAAFSVTDLGIAPPVKTTIGPNISTQGELVFSPEGNLVAASGAGGTMIFDFDINSGVLSNTVILPETKNYGIAFSPDGSKLYTQGRANSSLIQWDVGTMQSTVLAPLNTGGGQIFLGPDDKIYVGRNFKNFLGVVNRPNEMGYASYYELDGVPLSSSVKESLQNIVNLNLPISGDTLSVDFAMDTLCPDSTIYFVQPNCAFIYDTMPTIWYFGDGDSATYTTLTYPSHTYANPGIYIVTLIVSKDCYISDTIVRTVVVDTIPIVDISDTAICEKEIVNLASTILFVNQPALINWTGDVIDIVANPQISFTMAGTYNTKLSVTDNMGCVYSDSIEIVVNPIPVADSSIYTICAGNSILLNAGIGDTYTWLPSTYLSDVSIADPLSTPDTTISYRGIVTTNYCGSDTGIHTITVNALPVIQTINDTTIDLGNSVKLITTGGQAYTWTPTLYLDSPNIAMPTTNSPLDMLYIVSGTDSNGCINIDSVLITINVNEEFYVPNGFSPNGESNNDEFRVQGLTGDNTFIMRIYDRWGNKIFTSKDKNTGWSGTNRDAGVYVYIIQVELLNGLRLERKGNVTLVK